MGKLSGPLRPWDRGPQAQEAPPPPAPSRPTEPEGLTGSWSRGNPNWLLLALFLSLLGFAGVGGVLYLTKFLHYNASYMGFPTRVLFALSLALAAAPILVTVVQRVPVVYLIPPLILIFFLYPLFSPYGLPFSRDAVYNFQFAQAILHTGTWRPGLDVTNQAVVYSYFPGGAIFNAEVASFTGLPILGTYLWAQLLFRFLILPALVYALALKLFGLRAAALGVLLYVTVASIEMNVPTQQDFGVVFAALAVMALLLLWDAAPSDVGGLRVVVIVASTFVVASHHVSSYVLAIMLAGIAILPWIIRRRDVYPSLRAPVVLARYVITLILFTAIIAYPIANRLINIGALNVSKVATAATHAGVAVGATFPLYQTVWIGISIALVVVFALVTLILTWRVQRLALVTFSVLAALITAIIAIPFVSTGFSFLALRLMEYAGLILCPAAAWWLVNRLARRPERSAAASPPTNLRRFRQQARASAFLAMLLAFVIVAGGNLVPLSTRDQFAAPSSVLIDSPVNINQSAYAAATWAGNHLNRSKAIWGDELAYTALGGFGHLSSAYNPWPLFAGPGFNGTGFPGYNSSAPLSSTGFAGLQADTTCRVHTGDYVVTDQYLLNPALYRDWLAPVFPGPDQPIWNSSFTPSALAHNLTKFNDPRLFSLVYQDSVFYIYEIVSAATLQFEALKGTC